MTEKNQIWSEMFSTNIKGGGIYRIYFTGFEKHNYIGVADSYSPSFKRTINVFKGDFWKIFSGISPTDLLSKHYLLTQAEYLALNEDAKTSYDQKLARRRAEKLEAFADETLSFGQWEYWKMIYFMQINHLTLTDLRFEVLYRKKGNESWKEMQFNRLEMIDEYDAYVEGFNSDLLVKTIPTEMEEQKSADWLIRMKNIVLKKQSSQYTQWNCWWHLSQVFSSSFRDETLAWMDFWNQVSLEELTDDLGRLAYFIATQNQDAKFPNVKSLPADLQEILKHYPNKNGKLLLKNQRTGSFKKLVNINEWIKNDQDLWFVVNKINIHFHQKIMNFYGSWNDIGTFFAQNPFSNTRQLKTKIEVLNQNFLKQCRNLKDLNQSLTHYDWQVKAVNQEWFYPDYFQGDLIYDYFFEANFLTPLIFNSNQE